MKKLAVFVVVFATLTALVPAAAQSGTVAVGPIYSVNVLGFQGPLGGPGITGKIPGLAPVFGLSFSLSNQTSRYFLGLTADWLMYKQPLYAPANINFYLGPGFYSSVALDHVNSREEADLMVLKSKEEKADGLARVDAQTKIQTNRIDAGLRIPVGVNWTPLRFLECFAEVTPAFGVVFQDPVEPGWVFQAAVGARVWF